MRSTYEECKEAINNAEEVKVCPKSKEEWDIAARRKNCSKQAVLAEGKNCTIHEKQLEYHCLINAFRNKLLEVCEAAKTMFGNAGACFFLLFFMDNGYVLPKQIIHTIWLKIFNMISSPKTNY